MSAANSGKRTPIIASTRERDSARASRVGVAFRYRELYFSQKTFHSPASAIRNSFELRPKNSEEIIAEQCHFLGRESYSATGNR